MAKCKGCDKEATGYKWCDDCASKAKEDSNRRHRRAVADKKCRDCGDVIAKRRVYCESCARSRRMENTIRQHDRQKEEMLDMRADRYKGTINPMFLSRNCKHYEGHRPL